MDALDGINDRTTTVELSAQQIVRILRQHSLTFDERLAYGDANQNLRHNVNCIPLLPMPARDRPLVTFGTAVAPLVLAIVAAALRRRIPVPTPTC